jgi:hypothetical protein
MLVENDKFDRFVQACKKSSKPNKALRDAAKLAQEQGFY